jgi:8-amino-7-oxononanoate synthase
MGVRSAAIVSGHSRIHERLERELAGLKHTEACLLYPSGFAANLAAITALASDEHVAIFSDALNHASLIDGCRLARTRGASVHVYRHCDYGHLAELIQQKGVGKRKLVVTDGVFSMDGDCADVKVRLSLISPLVLISCSSRALLLICGLALHSIQ